MSQQSPALSEIRERIDSIDDRLLELLVERAAIMDEITAAKKAAAGEGGEAAKTLAPAIIRPAREAEVLRRLLGRDAGNLPKFTIFALWREIISSFSTLQGPFSIVTYDDRADGGLANSARDHFGATVPVRAANSAVAAIRAVSEARASAAVLPMPQEGEASPWWPLLFTSETGAPRIIARVPFLRAPANGGRPRADGFVVSLAPAEASGSDRTLLGIELVGDLSRSRLKDTMIKAGLRPQNFLASFGESEGGVAIQLVEADGFVAGNDARLKDAISHAGGAVDRILVIGNYPVPFQP